MRAQPAVGDADSIAFVRAFGPVLLSALLLGAGCSRRTEPPPDRSPVADTLANGLPRALLPPLGEWAEVWRYAVPGFTADSLSPGATGPFRFEYAWAGAGTVGDDLRTCAGIDVLSPDSAWSLDFDSYLDIGREGGGIELMREPDSAPVLADFRSDTLWRVAFCGTPCFYDGAAWADAERFALTGATRSGEQVDGPWQSFVDLYDLRSRQSRRWRGPTVEEAGFERYMSAMDSALAARVERARRAVPEHAEARSRVARQAP